MSTEDSTSNAPSDEQERKRAKYRAEHQANKEKRNAATRAWHWKNRDKVLARQKKYREANREARLEESRRYDQEHAAEKRARNRKWFAENPEKKRAYQLNRRARQANGGEHTPEELRQMYDDQQGLCAYCEHPLFGSYHVDHMIALAVGGRNDWTNLAIVCEPCNTRKGTKTVEDFMYHLITRY